MSEPQPETPHNPLLQAADAPSAAALQGNESPGGATTHRAARKAAAARLARQRHKGFINSLEGAISARRRRIHVLKRRKEDYAATAAAHMIRGLQAHLDPDRSLMLERWLRRSPTLAAALRMPTDEAWLRQLEQAEQAAAGASDEPPKKRGASAKAAAADTSLDEALAQQAFLEETLAAEDEAGCSSDEEEGCVVSMDVDLEWLLPSPRWVVAGDEDEELELEEIELEPALEWVSLDDTYGDGLSALLQHLLAQRRPSVKAPP